MSVNHVLRLILFYFAQPIFLVGLFYAWLNYKRRVKYTRETFRVNFNKRNFELRDYLLKGLLPGVLLSVLSVGIGIPLTFEWYIVYQILTILLLIIGGSRFIQPIFTFSLSALLLYSFNWLGIQFPVRWFEQIIPKAFYSFNPSINASHQLFSNLLLLALLILFVSTFLLDKKNEQKYYPIVRRSKRGKNVAVYQNKTLWMLPLVVLVPGDVIEPFASWWPLLNINGNQYAFLFLPLLIGVHFTISSQTPKEATTKLQNDFQFLTLFGLILFAISYVVPIFSRIAMVLILIGGFLVLYRHRKRENMWSFRYGPADEGLRVIAVRPDSPAERLDLSIGDILLEINDQKLLDTSEYNKVLAYSRSYIRVRIRRNDGEIVLAETPLYDDDYNNLGLLLLEK